MMADPVHIPHWLRISDRITTSGQPTGPQLAEIAALGVAAVINLALHSHERALPDERGDVGALGMAYVHIPVEFARPTESDFAAFAAAMKGWKDRKVHIHCIANFRVSAFLYRYRRDVLGGDERRARADLDRIWRPDPVWAAFLGHGTAS